jgi:hypothetical protein
MSIPAVRDALKQNTFRPPTAVAPCRGRPLYLLGVQLVAAAPAVAILCQAAST